MFDVSFLLILIIIVALIFDFTNGAHDCANAIASASRDASGRLSLHLRQRRKTALKPNCSPSLGGWTGRQGFSPSSPWCLCCARLPLSHSKSLLAP